MRRKGVRAEVDAGFVDSDVVGVLFPDVVTDAAHSGVELARNREDGVSDRFGLESARGHAPEEAIVAVDGEGRGIEPAGLAVG